MNDPRIVIDMVDREKRAVAANVWTSQAKHRLGHLPGEGWFCTCSKGKRCKHIDEVKALVPDMEQQ